MDLRPVKAFLRDAFAPGAECGVVQLRAYVNSDEARALKEMGVAKSSAIRPRAGPTRRNDICTSSAATDSGKETTMLTRGCGAFFA